MLVIKEKYKICFVTGSRAEYGRIRDYLQYLNIDKEINLEILLTGAILDEKYGSEVSIIQNDKLKIAYRLKLDESSTEDANIINNMSIILNEFGKYFNKNKYDLVILLGDRYEMLSVAISAAMNKIPILHIHGGEITLGNYDEFIRHSITKMSKYHFTSTEKYRNRVIQLGENPMRVFNIGAMSVENCKSINMDCVNNDLLKLRKRNIFCCSFSSRNYD